MSKVIEVQNLSKKYIIGHQRNEGYQTLREVVAKKATEFGKRFLHPFISSSGLPLLGAPNSEEFWALNNASFEIKQGERVGIIGRNGAGKSTLLKILSRITEPTSGRIKIRGQIASLLEVGTGFHPELTGRENIFLNGAILGMNRREIRKKFDEIIAFAEVEQFLDTPVKRYSSGMYVRLAFAVAAHLEPEILVVDEVLAVGDAQFQKKCLGKMKEVGAEGRTILFVSHDMGKIANLCSRCLLMEKGALAVDGDTGSVIEQYLSSSLSAGVISLTSKKEDKDLCGLHQILEVSTRSHDGNIKSNFVFGEQVVFSIKVRGPVGSKITMGLTIRNTEGNAILHLNSCDELENIPMKYSEQLITVGFKNILNDGKYFLTLFLADSYKLLIERIENCISFDVSSINEFENRNYGCVRVKSHWSHHELL